MYVEEQLTCCNVPPAFLFPGDRPKKEVCAFISDDDAKTLICL